jgi:S-adenosylmethionine:tRNA ribosyltransferase-isomerase
MSAAHDSPSGLACAVENSPGGSFSRGSAAPQQRVRLMVAEHGRPLVHTDFDSLPTHLRAGDLLIVNASATIPAALPARRTDGSAVDLHLSTPDPTHPERYIVELRAHGRRVAGRAQTLALPAGGRAELLAPYLSPGRLWVARLQLPEPLLDYLHHHGAPIRYTHDTAPRPLSDYQTIFATEPGSAEMPSAGRPFTRATLRALRAAGVSVQRITLHTGVSSQERGERPYPERYEVSAHTARRINERRGRVIAVGTTVVRALETVTGADGRVQAGRGWTNLVLTPERPVRAVDGLLTGWHDADASHQLLLEAVGGELVRRSYAASAGYRRHEFGDLHLILSGAR